MSNNAAVTMIYAYLPSPGRCEPNSCAAHTRVNLHLCRDMPPTSLRFHAHTIEITDCRLRIADPHFNLGVRVRV